MNKLRSKILNPASPVIFYELISPTNIEASNVEAYIECASDLLTHFSFKIDAVNIPEIRDEEKSSGSGNAVPSNYLSKMNSGDYAGVLENKLYKHTDVILNHCTVYEPWEDQYQWLESLIRHHIHHVVLVGGSSSKISYPGPSVLDMCDYIQSHSSSQQLLCGGITIQTRREEASRLFTKSLHGMEFFTSQIIYDAEPVKALLRDYDGLCKQQGVFPKRIMLSFAPVSTHGDLKFYRWLGVQISPEIESTLFQADLGVGWRSVKVCAQILQDILDYMKQENIKVPVGLNIEHITRHNFELSFMLVEQLGSLYMDYVRE